MKDVGRQLLEGNRAFVIGTGARLCLRRAGQTVLGHLSLVVDWGNSEQDQEEATERAVTKHGITGH